MTRLNELAAKLTPAQLKEVEDFAEFLAARGSVPRSPERQPVDRYLKVDAIAGLCNGMGGDKTPIELVHEANEIRAAEADD